MADSQVSAGGVSAAPLAYLVPGAQEIIVKAAFASFDGTLAAGDFLPCIRVLAPGGRVVGEYVTDEAVTAGNSAEVSWAPFLRSGGASALGESRVGEFWTTASHIVPSGVVTTALFDSQVGQTPPDGPLDYAGPPFSIAGVFNFRVSVWFVVQWPAGNYDRYIDIAQSVGFDPFQLFSYRARDRFTPDGDVQCLSATLVGNPSAAAAASFTLFQASGVDKTPLCYLIAYSWPEIAGQGGWPG